MGSESLFIEELSKEIVSIAPDLTSQLNEYTFIPNWNNRPEQQPPVISLNGVPILTKGNSTAIVSHPGGGKTSLLEATIASMLNPSADTLGIKVEPSIEGIICADFERTNTDVWNSFSRIAKRAGIPYGGPVENITIAGMRSVARLKDRRQSIIHLLENNPCGLLLLDGGGDLVNDTNDLSETVENRIWLRETIAKYRIAALITIHPNPGTDKPRGHQGSEICRESECVLLAKKHEAGDFHVLTTDFIHGKNRNNSNDLTAAFQWSDHHGMFVSCDIPEDFLTGGKAGRKRLPDAVEIAESTHKEALQITFQNQPQLNNTAFLKAFISAWNNDEGGRMGNSRADTFKHYYIQKGFIKVSNGAKNNEKILELNEVF